jgi:hypothetical protein
MTFQAELLIMVVFCTHHPCCAAATHTTAAFRFQDPKRAGRPPDLVDRHSRTGRCGVMKRQHHLLRSSLWAVLVALVCAFPAAVPAFAQAQLTLDINGLEDLGPTALYEGWLIVGGLPVSTGTFSVDTGGQMSQTSFAVDSADAMNATAFVLTIEPVPDADPNPSVVHYLGGGIVNDAGTLSVAHAAAIGDDFSSASGGYVLAAPSATVPDYRNGIWWLDPLGPTAGLTLPVLPAGWVYEGWVVDMGVVPALPISTGRFSAVDAADSDGGGPLAGPNATPSFPGQDFVTVPRDLTVNHVAVITIEPEPDNSAAPFTLKPLTDPIEDVGGGTLQPMTNQAAAFPSGTLVITQGVATMPAWGLILLSAVLAFIGLRALRKLDHGRRSC